MPGEPQPAVQQRGGGDSGRETPRKLTHLGTAGRDDVLLVHYTKQRNTIMDCVSEEGAPTCRA